MAKLSGLGVTGTVVDGTGVTALHGNIRAGFLGSLTMKTRDASRCSSERIIDGMMTLALEAINSSANKVSENIDILKKDA